MIKEWFASLKYIIPSEMEYYLEEKAAQGYILQEIGESGFFYFTFSEQLAEKCKYVVDVTSLPKAMYMESVMENDWEYMGKVMNCYVWKKSYTDERPEDFADLESRKKHCTKWGIGMLIAALVFLATSVALIWAIVWEKQTGQEGHMVTYIIEAVINLPFIIYFGYLAKRLFSYKEEKRIPKKNKVEEPVSEELDFVKNKN